MGKDIYADLHVHTTHSDGTFELAEVPEAARQAGLDAVAITDHDRVHPGLDEPFEQHGGVDVIRGIELRVEPEALDERIDLLGYGVRETPALQSEITRLQQNRKERAAYIIERVESHTGVSLDIEVSAGIGRPHIARAIDEHPGIDVTYDGAFEELIGNDCPCYKSRDVTSFEKGVELLSEACGLIGLAHPYRYADFKGALELADRLDAVECHYPYSASNQEKAEREAVETAEMNGLVETGGSDAHETDLALAGLSESEYDEFAEAAGFSK